MSYGSDYPPAYRSKKDLPKDVRLVLPEDAQEVFAAAYNSALASANPDPLQAAWSAVELGWEIEQGLWKPRR